MFKRNWGAIFEAGLAIAFIVVIVPAGAEFWLLYSGQQRYYAQERAYQTEHQHSIEQERPISCWTIMSEHSFLGGLQCFNQAVQGKPERTASDDSLYDVEASQDAALWTLGATLIAALTLITGLFGIIFVIGNFRQTRAALSHAAEANKISREEQRPWLKFDLKMTKQPEYHEDRIILPIDVDIENLTKTPAVDVQFMCEVLQRPNVPEQNLLALARDMAMKRRIPNIGKTVYPGPIYIRNMSWNSVIDPDRSGMEFVAFSITYRRPSEPEEVFSTTGVYSFLTIPARENTASVLVPEMLFGGHLIT